MKKFISKEQSLDTIIGENCDVEVFYEYTPGYPARIRYDENDYPGSGPEIIINRVEINGKDIHGCLTQKCIDRLEQEIDEWEKNGSK